MLVHTRLVHRVKPLPPSRRACRRLTAPPTPPRRGRRTRNTSPRRRGAPSGRSTGRRYGRSCKVRECGVTTQLHVHHHTYRRLGQRASDRSCRAVCRPSRSGPCRFRRVSRPGSHPGYRDRHPPHTHAAPEPRGRPREDPRARDRLELRGEGTSEYHDRECGRRRVHVLRKPVHGASRPRGCEPSAQSGRPDSASL